MHLKSNAIMQKSIQMIKNFVIKKTKMIKVENYLEAFSISHFSDETELKIFPFLTDETNFFSYSVKVEISVNVSFKDKRVSKKSEKFLILFVVLFLNSTSFQPICGIFNLAI